MMQNNLTNIGNGVNRVVIQWVIGQCGGVIFEFGTAFRGWLRWDGNCGKVVTVVRWSL